MRLNTCFYSCLAAIGLTLSLGTQCALGLVTVTVQPGNQVVFVGTNVVFNAQVITNAGERITSYAWLTSTNGLNPFTTVPGATTSTCTLTNVQTRDTGFYFARVTFNSGTNMGLTSVSAAVGLTVQDQARITAQPQGGLIRLVGDSASFSVSQHLCCCRQPSGEAGCLCCSWVQ
ncbi:MAG: immunoglobulin domain-containing protein [Verrucomicrobia bacterium]|nr:immunoglobulin domain-containing protein [Verrucomicrobiota bacterium]